MNTTSIIYISSVLKTVTINCIYNPDRTTILIFAQISWSRISQNSLGIGETIKKANRIATQRISQSDCSFNESLGLPEHCQNTDNAAQEMVLPPYNFKSSGIRRAKETNKGKGWHYSCQPLTIKGRPWTKQCSVLACTGVHSPFFMHQQVTGQPVGQKSQEKTTAGMPIHALG